MILDSASSHVVSSAEVGKSRGFSTLELSNMTLVFLPPNVTSIVQPLDQNTYNYIKGLKEGGAQHQTSYHVEL
jgi:hypothetical protein